MKVVMEHALLRFGSDSEFVEQLRDAFPQVTFRLADTEKEKKAEIQDAEIYYGRLSREVFLAAEHLRWIHNPSTGIEHYTKITELVESDVVLTNCRGPHAPSMADHVIGMMVLLAHCMREQLEDQRLHRWEPTKYLGRQIELSGKTMGILALGDIGTAIARRARGFGMEVYGIDRHPSTARRRSRRWVRDVWGLERLVNVLQISDWLVVAAPITPESRGLVDRRALSFLKEGAHVIAISRGNIVDEQALIDSLQSGRVAGAGLDVFAEEPLSKNSPLWDMPNVVLSPHCSGVTPEMFEGRRQIFKENLRRYLAGEPFLYVCDKRAGF
jgi:phosphoglycerate dehydrogenase-like enzyme